MLAYVISRWRSPNNCGRCPEPSEPALASANESDKGDACVETEPRALISMEAGSGQQRSSQRRQPTSEAASMSTSNPAAAIPGTAPRTSSGSGRSGKYDPYVSSTDAAISLVASIG